MVPKVDAYLTEDGRGAYRKWYVADLVHANARQVELLFVFESPHADELHSGAPVVGGAGRTAIRYLLSDPSCRDSLGRFVKRKHTGGDYRIAIMNVCDVPLQESAFEGRTAPDVPKTDWELIEKIRTSTSRSPSTMRSAAAKTAADALLQSFQTRVDSLPIGGDFRLFACGVFAGRFCDSLEPIPGGAPLHLPHPSINGWNRRTQQYEKNLIDARRLFTKLV